MAYIYNTLFAFSSWSWHSTLLISYPKQLTYKVFAYFQTTILNHQTSIYFVSAYIAEFLNLLISSIVQGRFTRNTALCVFVLEQTHINFYFYFLLGLIHFFKSHLIQPCTQNRVLIILLSTVTQTMQLHPFVFVQGH